jgi:hypothetical protein
MENAGVLWNRGKVEPAHLSSEEGGHIIILDVLESLENASNV